MNDLLARVSDPTYIGRDLLIDELNDQVVSGHLNQAEQEFIVRRLLNQLEHEGDAAVNESIFNLLATVFENGILKHCIVDGIVKFLNEIPPGCLVHAIPIIANSYRPDKIDLLLPFIQAENVAIRDVMTDARKPESILTFLHIS